MEQKLTGLKGEKVDYPTKIDGRVQYPILMGRPTTQKIRKHRT